MATLPPPELHDGKSDNRELIKVVNWLRRQFIAAPPITPALSDPGSNGIVVRTAPGVTASRTLVAGDTTVVITNGDGVAGNPSIVGHYQAGLGITITGNVIAGTGGTVTSVSGTTGRISSTGGTTPVIDLVNTGVTPGSFTYASLTVDAAGRLTAASSGTAPLTSITGTPPIFVTGGNNVTIQGAIVSGSTSTTAQNLGSGTSGVVQQTVSGGAATLAQLAGTAGSIPFFGPSSVLVQDNAALFWNDASAILGVGTNAPNAFAVAHFARSTNGETEVIVTNPNAGIGAVAAFRVTLQTTGSPPADSLVFAMLGTNFSTIGSLTAKSAFFEHAATGGNFLFSELSGGDFVWLGGSRIERLRLTNAGKVQVVDLSVGGLVKAAAATGQLGIATAGSDYVAPSTTLSATSPIRIDGGASADLSSNRTLSIQGAIVSGSTSTTAQNIGVLSSGVMLEAVVAGVATLATYAPTASRLFIGTSSSGITDSPNLTYNTGTNLFAVNGDTIDSKGNVVIVQAASTSGSPTAVSVTGGAHTTLAASAEAIDVNLNLARTVQFSSGALTTQRAVFIQAPTYAISGGGTVTTAATVAISGAPVAGTATAITNPYALLIQGGDTSLGGNLFITGRVTSGDAVLGSPNALGANTYIGTTNAGAGGLPYLLVQSGLGTGATEGSAALVVANKVTSSAAEILDSFTVAGTAVVSGTTTIATGAFSFSRFKVPLIAGTGANTVTVSNPVTLSIDGPPAISAGTGTLTLGTPRALWVHAGMTEIEGTFLHPVVTVASAGDITLSGNINEVTGTVSINTVSTAGWLAGAVVWLYFDGALTVNNNAAGAFTPIFLVGGANLALAAGSKLQLLLIGSGWHELSHAGP